MLFSNQFPTDPREFQFFHRTKHRGQKSTWKSVDKRPSRKPMRHFEEHKVDDCHCSKPKWLRGSFQKPSIRKNQDQQENLIVLIQMSEMAHKLTEENRILRKAHRQSLEDRNSIMDRNIALEEALQEKKKLEERGFEFYYLSLESPAKEIKMVKRTFRELPPTKPYPMDQ